MVSQDLLEEIYRKKAKTLLAPSELPEKPCHAYGMSICRECMLNRQFMHEIHMLHFHTQRAPERGAASIW